MGITVGGAPTDDWRPPSANLTCAELIAYDFDCSSPGCASSMAGYFNYVTLLECTISCCGPDSGLLLDVASYAMLLALYLALLMLLESITDNYFAASTKLIVRFMKLSPPVAGVTFLAVGNGASDVFSSIAAFSSGTPKTGVGTLLGAAFFVATVVVGVVALLSDGGVKLDRGAFLREVTFLLISACYLAWALADNDVTVGEICGFFGLYVSFVLVVVAQSLAAKRERAREEAAASLVGQPTKRETSQISLRDSDLEYGSNGAGYMSSGGSVAGTSHGRARGGPSRERSRSDLARSSSSLLGNDLDGFRPRSWSSDTVDLIAMRDEDGEARLPALTKGSYWTMSFLQAVGAPDAPRLSGAPASHAHHAGEHDARSSSATHSSVPGAVAGETEDSTHKSKHKKDASAPDEAAGHGMSQRAPLRYMRRVARRLLLPQLVSRVRLVLIRPVLAAIRFPFQIAWALTIPSLEEHRWNWRLAVVNPVCGSLLIGFTSFDSWMLASLLPSSYHAPWLRGWVVVASIGMIGSAWVGCTVPRARPPYPIRYIDSTEADSDSDSSGGNTDDDAPGGSHADQAPTADEFIVRRADKQRKYAGAGSCNEVALFVVLASLAFVAAVIHIVLIANEVVSIAATFGLILDMSPSMVGLSILAIANSIQDLAADVTIARRGYPSMAVAGAYAGPIFNILLGLGIPLSIGIARHGHVSLGQDNATMNISFTGFIVALVVSFIAVRNAGYVIKPWIGGLLIAIYAVYLGIVCTYESLYV